MFDSLQKKSRFFKHPEDEAIHIALAAVLYNIISADHSESTKELRGFSSILAQEFDLNEDQIEHLYQTVKSSTREMKADLETIDKYLKESPVIRMKFMDKLNQLVGIDGVLEEEMDIFNEALHVIFPEIRRV